MFAPAGTPQAVIDKIAKDVRTVEQSADVKERFATLGAEPMPFTPQEFTKFVQTEIDGSAKVIQAAGIKAQ
jgi:tripartite-type tricarboxylate transporter receptor subunit TctC